MKVLQRVSPAAGRLLFVVLSALVLAGCAIRLVADYDAAAYEESIAVGKKVDRFYGDLLETPAADRHYQKYAARYVEIETDLRSLYVRNKARALNSESAEISQTILDLWLKYKANHAAKDTYGDGVAKLDRGRFTRLFISAANAESAKNLAAQDKNVQADSN